MLDAEAPRRALMYISRPELCNKAGLIDWVEGLAEEVEAMRASETTCPHCEMAIRMR